MRACGICGSDLMEWYVAPRAPLVLGHEPAGVVVERRARACRRPARACSSTTTSRAASASTAARGHETLCETFKATRIEPGGFSELILVPAANAALRPARAARTRVSDEAATLIEPLACCVRGLDRARRDRRTRGCW